MEKVHTILLVGQREQEAGNLAVREHGKGDLGAKPKAEVIMTCRTNQDTPRLTALGQAPQLIRT